MLIVLREFGKDVLDDVQKRLGSWVGCACGLRVEDRVGLAGGGHEPEVRVEIREFCRGQGRDILLLYLGQSSASGESQVVVPCWRWIQGNWRCRPDRMWDPSHTPARPGHQGGCWTGHGADRLLIVVRVVHDNEQLNYLCQSKIRGRE